MAKYLVTGGCGFIGSHLTRFLIEKGDQVRILDDLSNSTLDKRHPEAELIIGSITNPDICKQALRGVDGCFHLAACVSVLQSCKEWSFTHRVNCGGTVTLFEQAGAMPMIYASSAAVYGDSHGKALQEETPLNPLSPYAVDKISSEMHAALGWQLFKMPSVGFRFFNVVGVGQDPNSPYAGVVAIFSKKILKGESIEIFGDGEQKRDFVAVSDVARILALTMEHNFQGHTIYNLATGTATSINQLVAYLEEISGKTVKKLMRSPRLGDIRYSCGDPTKLKQELGFRTHISLYKELSESIGRL